MALEFDYVSQTSGDSIHIEIPLAMAAKPERNLLINEPQGVLAIGLITCSYGLNTMNYGVHNDAFILSRNIEKPDVWFDVLYDYIKDAPPKDSTELLSVVFSALSGYRHSELVMPCLFTKKMNRYLLRVRNALHLKIMVAVPFAPVKEAKTITVRIDPLSLHLMRPLNYHIMMDVELWQAVIFIMKVGLIVKSMVQYKGTSKIKLRNLIVTLIHISQIALARAGR